MIETQSGTKRIPNDSFEANLYLAHIRNQVRQWPQRTYNASVSDEYRGDEGVWTLIIAAKEDDLDYEGPVRIGMPEPDDMLPVELGEIWLEDVNGRVVIGWRLGWQSNTGHYPPRNPWGYLETGGDIRDLRERLELTGPAFADRLNQHNPNLRVNANTVSRWERDKQDPNRHAQSALLQLAKEARVIHR